MFNGGAMIDGGAMIEDEAFPDDREAQPTRQDDLSGDADAPPATHALVVPAPVVPPESRGRAQPEEVVAQLEAWYGATLRSLHADLLRDHGPVPRAWDEQDWILHLGRRAEAAERGRGDLAMQLVAEQLQVVELRRRVASLEAAGRRADERDREQERRIVDLRRRVAEAEGARAEAEARIQAFRRDGERTLAELRELVATYHRRVEAAERDRDILAERLRERG